MNGNNGKPQLEDFFSERVQRKMLQVRVDESILEAMKGLTEAQERTMTEAVEALFRFYLAKHGKLPKKGTEK